MYRIRCSPNFDGSSSNFIGSIVDWHTHSENKRTMVRLTFANALHQQLWGGAWFYVDDLEEVA